MKICAFIGDMYREYSSALILAIRDYAIGRGHKVDVFGNNRLQIQFQQFRIETVRDLGTKPLDVDAAGIFVADHEEVFFEFKTVGTAEHLFCLTIKLRTRAFLDLFIHIAENICHEANTVIRRQRRYEVRFHRRRPSVE